MVTGGTNSSNGDVTANHGQQDAWRLKLDEFGNLLWQRSYGTNNNEAAFHAVNVPNGYVFIANDSKVRYIDFSGNEIWQKTLSTTNLWTINYLGNNEFIVGGHKNNDAYLAKLGMNISINVPSPNSICIGESITLTAATETGLTVKWYDSQTAITPIFTGNPFTISNLTTTTTYWVEAVSLEGCKSERISTEIVVIELPAFTLESAAIEICTGSTVDLEVTTAAENEVSWYSTQTGTTPIFVGNPFSIPNLNVTTSYWVEVESEEGCPSERQEIIVEIVDSIVPIFDKNNIVLETS